MKWLVFTLILFGNLWIWKIFEINFLIFILCITGSVYLKKYSEHSNRIYLVFILLILLFVGQVKIEGVKSYKISVIEKVVQERRLREYPIKYLRLGYWMEGRKESVIFYKLMNNLGEVVDLNYYFFANHPRERAAIREFERFPYIYLPFFVYGLIIFVDKKRFNELVILAGVVALLTYIGIGKDLGPVVLFPIMVFFIFEGVWKVLNKKFL